MVQAELAQPGEGQLDRRAHVSGGARLEVHGDGREGDQLAQHLQAALDLFDRLGDALELAFDGQRLFDVDGLEEQRFQALPHDLGVAQADLQIGVLFADVTRVHLTMELVAELADAAEGRSEARGGDAHCDAVVVAFEQITAGVAGQLLDLFERGVERRTPRG